MDIPILKKARSPRSVVEEDLGSWMKALNDTGVFRVVSDVFQDKQTIRDGGIGLLLVTFNITDGEWIITTYFRTVARYPRASETTVRNWLSPFEELQAQTVHVQTAEPGRSLSELLAPYFTEDKEILGLSFYPSLDDVGALRDTYIHHGYHGRCNGVFGDLGRDGNRSWESVMDVLHSGESVAEYLDWEWNSFNDRRDQYQGVDIKNSRVPSVVRAMRKMEDKLKTVGNNPVVIVEEF